MSAVSVIGAMSGSSRASDHQSNGLMRAVTQNFIDSQKYPLVRKEIPAARKADGVKRENDESSIRGFPPFLRV